MPSRGWQVQREAIPLSGCRSETAGAGRGQGPAQLSDENRHLVLGITCRQMLAFRSFSGKESGC